MNKQQSDVLLAIAKHGYENQRTLAEQSGCSLGVVNSALKTLAADGFLSGNNSLSQKAKKLLDVEKPKRAVILAAGLGLRMIPINNEFPKALLEVKGETLIERQISQLNDVGITDITVVVGFMRERFEYLIDKCGVSLAVNRDYALKNNLHSLALVKDRLENAYIVPSDIYSAENPFSEYELYPWYAVTDEKTDRSDVRVNRREELVCVKPQEQGNAMIGIAYLNSAAAKTVKARLCKYRTDPAYDGSFWEDTLYTDGKADVFARVLKKSAVLEVNTYEQLRSLDSGSRSLRTEIIKTVERVMRVDENKIKNIAIQKKGMTNRSFIFDCENKRYIMRIPGEGTEMLINRAEEANVYGVVNGKGLSDDVVYINPENGYKITEFLKGSRCCDAYNPQDVARCMEKLREFHSTKLSVDHVFDIFGKIDFYESLWNGVPSGYGDYAETKANVFSLKSFIDENALPYQLTHIDAVPDNFLFYNDENGNERIRLIDWEYAAMQDPHVDIAMFAIYALYGRDEIEALIDAYFTNGCSKKTRIKIYCYIAACGLCWSNWCEYKRNLGVEFGEYSLKQYRYAKEYYRIARAATEELTEE